MDLENITIGMRVRETCTGDEGYVTEIKKDYWSTGKYEVYVDWMTGPARGQNLHVFPQDLEEVESKHPVDTSKWHPHHDIIVAWAKGAKIECYAVSTRKWVTTPYPLWAETTQYRVKPKETTYSIGQILTEESDDKEQFLIAQVEVDKVCLTSLVTGNRWFDPIAVKSTRAITQEELKKMSGNLKFKT
jgi:hypothetical protein